MTPNRKLTLDELRAQLRAHPMVRPETVQEWPGKDGKLSEMGYYRHGVQAPSYHAGPTMEQAYRNALHVLFLLYDRPTEEGGAP